MFEIVRYTPEHQDEWNAFVKQSKNGLFLFDRGYMDYHRDRFHDHSLLFYRNGKLYALLPANVKDDILYSHQGLTFGGLLLPTNTHAADILTLFREMNGYLRREDIRQVVYKSIPWIYHRIPSEEDLYAIFHECDFQISVRNLSCTIPQPNALRWEQIRRRALKRAMEANIQVEESDDLTAFWQVLQENLMQKYEAAPVHTLEEITLLHQRFPKNIRLFNAYLDHQVIGGILVYVSQQVVHTQYISSTAEGKQYGAIDIISDTLINDIFKNHPYFDFGTSNEDGGRTLNESLIFQKEGFGARGVCYDTYTWLLE